VEALKAFARTGEFPLAMILWGPFGSGKTTSAKGVVRDYLVQRGIFEPPGPSFPGDLGGKQLIGIFTPVLFIAGGAVVSVEAIRGEVSRFMQTVPPGIELGLDIKKFVIIDEGDKLSHEAQGALQTLIEMRPKTITIWTTNYLERINPAIRSRAAGGIFEFKLPSREDIAMHLRRLASKEKVEVPLETVEKIAREAESVRDAVGILGTEIAKIRAKAPPPLFPPAPPPPIAPPPKPPEAPPKPPPVKLPLSEGQIELLFEVFRNQLKISLGRELARDPKATEITEFESLIAKLQAIPTTTYQQAKSEVERLAKAFSKEERAGRIYIRRGIPTEEEILGEEPIPPEYRYVEEIEYPTPEYELIADSGPLPPPPPYPRGMGKYWDLESANENKEILEAKGYKIRVQMLS